MGRRYTPMLNRIDFQIVVSLWKTGLAFATSWNFSIEILNNLYELSTLSASLPNGTKFLWFMITSVHPNSCIFFKLMVGILWVTSSMRLLIQLLEVKYISMVILLPAGTQPTVILQLPVQEQGCKQQPVRVCQI